MNIFLLKDLISLEGFVLSSVVMVHYLMGGVTLSTLLLSLLVAVVIIANKQRLPFIGLFISVALLAVSYTVAVIIGGTFFYIPNLVLLLTMLLTLVVHRHRLSIYSLAIPIGLYILFEILKLISWAVEAYLSGLQSIALLAVLTIFISKMQGLSLKELILGLVAIVSIPVAYGVINMHDGFGFSVLLPVYVLIIIVIIFAVHFMLALVGQFCLRISKKSSFRVKDISATAARFACIVSIYITLFVTIYYRVRLNSINSISEELMFLILLCITLASLVAMVRRLFLDTREHVKGDGGGSLTNSMDENSPAVNIVQ